VSRAAWGRDRFRGDPGGVFFGILKIEKNIIRKNSKIILRAYTVPKVSESKKYPLD
jgi:hypothetical protein